MAAAFGMLGPSGAWQVDAGESLQYYLHGGTTVIEARWYSKKVIGVLLIVEITGGQWKIAATVLGNSGESMSVLGILLVCVHEHWKKHGE